MITSKQVVASCRKRDPETGLAFKQFRLPADHWSLRYRDGPNAERLTAKPRWRKMPKFYYLFNAATKPWIPSNAAAVAVKGKRRNFNSNAPRRNCSRLKKPPSRYQPLNHRVAAAKMAGLSLHTSHTNRPLTTTRRQRYKSIRRLCRSTQPGGSARHHLAQCGSASVFLGEHQN